jgi:uncharacterized protein YidB (DUF937 family)
MGMLDGLIGSALGGMMGAGGSGSGQAQSPLLQIALQLLQQNGGVGGILDKFRQGGYADQADSWQSTGQNMPLSGNALQEVLGSGAIGQIAGQLGMSHGDAAGGLAQMLPQLIDRFTPNGEVPDNQNDVVAQALAMLTQTKTG